MRTLTVVEPPPAHGPPAAEFFAANRRLMEVFAEQGVAEALEEFTRVAGAGHSVATSHSAEVAELLIDFVQRHGGGTGAGG